MTTHAQIHHQDTAETDLTNYLVRYDELRPCRTAFIDTKTPGSHLKENFTIIGPGVAENPDQHVHIRRPHGFNIGAARQPPGCTNSQHFHETAEVFFVHSGLWAFRSGEYGTEGEVVIGPGDVISIPIHIFRGFENVGTELGFLYAVLGGDDPGRVTWAPQVINAAKAHGLILAANGRLIDTSLGGRLEPGEVPVEPMRADELGQVVRHADDAAMATIVARRADQAKHPVEEPYPGLRVTTLIAGAADQPNVPLAWPHGFTCQIIEFQPGAAFTAHACASEDVWFIHQGKVSVDWGAGEIDLGPGDVVSIPTGATRTIRADGAAPALAFVTTRGDMPVKRLATEARP